MESYLIWCKCLGLWPRETASQYLWENCSKEAGGEVGPYTSLHQREQAVWTSKIRYQVKEFRILCMRRCKPVGSLNSFLSYAPQLSGTKSCFLVHLKEWQMAASCNPPSQQSPRRVAASVGSQFGEPSFTSGGQKSLMAVTFPVYWYGRRYFHFTTSFPASRNRIQLTGWDWA